jgi:hypothetical protein
MTARICLLIVTVLFSFSITNAQYNKITFKERVDLARQNAGLTLGGTMHFMGNGKGTPNSFFIGLTNINEEKRWFSWISLAVVLPVKFSYTTMGAVSNDNWTDAVTITGKTSPVIMGDLNFGCFLHNIENTESKIKPFLSFGFNGLITDGVNENTINRDKFPVNYYSFQKEPSTGSVGIGVKGGGGILFQFSPSFALKLDGGYNLVGNLSSNAPGPGLEEKNFFAYTSNPYASAGLVIHIGNRDK